MADIERELGWDDEISNDGEEFTVLPAGDYDFEVVAFERGRHDGEVTRSAAPEGAPVWTPRFRWEQDTLVVDAAGFNGEAWFDRSGNYASSSLKVVERYSPMGPNALMYEATIEDPTVFTRPWTIRLPLYRRLEEHARVLEFKCVEFSEELLYGHLRKTPTR